MSYSLDDIERQNELDTPIEACNQPAANKDLDIPLEQITNQEVSSYWLKDCPSLTMTPDELEKETLDKIKQARHERYYPFHFEPAGLWWIPLFWASMLWEGMCMIYGCSDHPIWEFIVLVISPIVGSILSYLALCLGKSIFVWMRDNWKD
jgi:hypothetical protein